MQAGYWNYCTGYLRGFLGCRTRADAATNAPDDPIALLEQAQQEMKENQARNRERMVQVIMQKNYLQALVEQQQKTVENLQDKIEFAQFKSDAELARRLTADQDKYRATLEAAEKSLHDAREAAETAKKDMRREEERIRAKTAQAASLKALWHQCQIEPLSQSDEGLAQIGYLTKALILHVQKVRDDLQAQADRASRQGNQTRAERLRAIRDEFQAGLCA